MSLSLHTLLTSITIFENDNTIITEMNLIGK